MLQCADGTLYTGITNDLEARLKRHGAGKGAKYTRSRLPVCLVRVEPCTDRVSAMRRERRVKSLSRADKLALILQSPAASARQSIGVKSKKR